MRPGGSSTGPCGWQDCKAQPHPCPRGAAQGQLLLGPGPLSRHPQPRLIFCPSANLYQPLCSPSFHFKTSHGDFSLYCPLQGLHFSVWKMLWVWVFLVFCFLVCRTQRISIRYMNNLSSHSGLQAPAQLGLCVPFSCFLLFCGQPSATC